MGNFEVLARLVEVFGGCMRVSSRFYEFQIRRGAKIKVRRYRPAGVGTVARFRDDRLRYFPNSQELGWFLESEVRREWVGYEYEYTVDGSHIEDVISIILDG